MDYNYFISELSTLGSHVERLKRGLEQERDRQSGQREPEYALEAPAEIKYDRERLDAPPRPARPRREDAPEPARQAAPHQNGGAELELDVDTLHVADDGERKTFRVRGGAFRKWGVFIWPEVLERDFGIDSDNIKPGLHPFKYRVRILMDGDKPKKVVGLVQ